MSRRLILLALCLCATHALADDGAGFIYGTLTTEDGDAHTGFLRWEGEEAYWNDLFNSRQVDAPFFDEIDLDVLHQEQKKKYFAEHGLFDRLMWSLNNSGDQDKPTRIFISRFGDMAAIDQDDEENVVVTMNDGRRVPVSGYANDVSSDILVYTGAEEPELVEWEDMRRIEFAQAPPGTVPYARRIHAETRTKRGDIEGFLMWDESECTSIDIIDADEQDVELGRIRHFEKLNTGSSRVALTDGTVLDLSGTNDVDDGHRGVFIEEEGVGRIKTEWKHFLEATFHTDRGSGPARGDFDPIRELHGTLTDNEGASFTGRVVFDLDEGWTCDIFNGHTDKREIAVPFGNIAAIARTGESESRLTLRSGRVLEVEGNQDTGENHAGFLIYGREGADPVHVPWSRFQMVEFTP